MVNGGVSVVAILPLWIRLRPNSWCAARYRCKPLLVARIVRPNFFLLNLVLLLILHVPQHVPPHHHCCLSWSAVTCHSSLFTHVSTLPEMTAVTRQRHVRVDVAMQGYLLHKVAAMFTMARQLPIRRQLTPRRMTLTRLCSSVRPNHGFPCLTWTNHLYVGLLFVHMFCSSVLKLLPRGVV